jgi:hypothetical protein
VIVKEQNAQVSDTTEDEQSDTVGKQKLKPGGVNFLIIRNFIAYED